MRSPSVKALLAAFAPMGLDAEGARMIKRIARATDNPKELERLVREKGPRMTYHYALSLLSSPYDSHVWRVTIALHAIDSILGTHGVEALGEGAGPSYAPPYEYCNAGDPYVRTLVYTRKTDTLRIACWGDIVERIGS